VTRAQRRGVPGRRRAPLEPRPEGVARAAPLVLGLIALALVWALGRAANPGPLGFRLDDAWIHMVYGRGLLANGYLAYNDGVPTTGSTSPLWTVVLAALHALFGRADPPDPLVLSVLLTGAALLLGNVAAAARLARRLSGSDLTGAIAGGLVALAIPFVAASFSGMEVVLASLLLLLGTDAVATGAWTRAGLWLAAAGLARPECGATILVLAAAAAGLSGRGHRFAAIRRLLLPPLVAALALVAYDLWASGAPLPSTFYAKSGFSLPALPARLWRALTRMLATVPPFGYGAGWIAMAGLLREARRQTGGRPAILPATGEPRAAGAPAAAWLPFAAGAAYLLANLLVLRPADPAAFYHLRYLLPPVPLLLVAAALGARAWGDALSRPLPRASGWPLALLFAAALVQASLTAGPESRHLHNDVRNINEVQRRIGERLRGLLPAGTGIAASDAGAVRYFSRLPTLDVMGLNTPQMRDPTAAFRRSHPVAAFAYMPAWFETADVTRLEIVLEETTRDYTVTSNPDMATQDVVRATAAATAEARGEPVTARFTGQRAVALDFVPPGRARWTANRRIR
jgi:hypothetical protein